MTLMSESTTLEPLAARRVAGQRSDALAHLVGGLSGNERDYRAFLAALADWLHDFIARQLPRSPGEVEDLVQETLLAIHNKRGTYDPAKPLDAWVQAIAHHKVVDYLRRGHKIVEPVDEGSMQPDHNGDCGALHASEARHDVLQLLGGLPDKQRRAILHLKIEGLSVAETAALIGTSEVAVKLYVHRGLKSIAAKWRA
ncbi:sigma-70 family RNA polymerase sigma factor [Piscinibacter defluvii]|uniref:sigma-70 family RNA polymerase sigma factor n=1 Tax=Piscinibacter defluvii TaxID=1796922 RepID=UPI001F0C6711|nr:sigma-70 family RNA polymerase sigma factor [Piscinibacter defluvii]